MRTLVLQEPEHFVRSQTEAPTQPEAGQALVRVHRVGICGTDLHAFKGRQPFFSYPRILGHELGVEVLALSTDAAPGEGDSSVVRVGHQSVVEVGDLCAVEPYLHCGRCQACVQGHTNCCMELQVLGVHTDGGMREVIEVPINKLHSSAQLAADQLALVETLGIGAHAVERAALRPEDAIVIIGAGPIGLSVLQFARLSGAPLVVLERDAGRRRFCAKNFGVQHCLSGAEDPLPQIQDILGGRLPTAVFDATGNAASMMQAFNYVAHHGRLIFVGFVQGDITFHSPEFHRRELTVMGSRNARSEDFKRIIGWMEEGRVDTRPWITHRSDYAALIETFPDWLEPGAGVVKAMLEL